MSINFVIRTKLENSGIVKAEAELRKLFEQGESLRAQSVSGGAGGLPSVSPINAEGIQRGNDALKESINLLKQAREQAKAAGREAVAQGKLAEAGGFSKVAQGYQKQIQLLKQLQPEQKKVSRNQQIINSNAEAFRGARTAKDYQRALKTINATLKETAALQLKGGDFGGFEGTKKASADVKAFSNSLKELQDEGESTSGVADVMNSRFNQLGFTMLITINTIKQITDALAQMFEVALDGAQMADRIQSFTNELGNAGINAQKMRSDLQEAGQGIVTLDIAMKGTIQLLKSGLPEAAKSSDELLRIATNAAIVSGEVDKADEIYQKLIRGIVRASPRLIDDADILLKLGDAYSDYAETLGKTSDELTVVEQKMATLQAVMGEGERINEMAENMESVAQPLLAIKTEMTNTIDVLKIFIGLVGSDMVVATGEGTVKGSEFVGILQSLGLVSAETSAQLEGVYSTLSGRVASTLSIIVASVQTFIGVIKNFISVGISGFQELLNAFGTVKDVVTGDLSASEGIDQLSESFGRLSDTGMEQVDFMKSGAGFAENYQKSMARFGIAVGKTEGEVGKLNESLADLRKEQAQAQLGDQLSDMENALNAAIDARTGIEAQHSEKLLDARQGLSEKLTDIEEKLGDKLADIKSSYSEKLLKLSRDFRAKAEDIAQDTADKLADIDEDLADKLQDATQNAQEERVDAVKDKNKAIEDIAEDHQRELADIEKKFQISRMKALIDRDARALFEAQQARNSDIDSANDSAVTKREDEEEQLKEKIEEIAKKEQKQRQDAIENAAKRRQDAKDDAAKRLADLKSAHAKQRREAKRAMEKQRQDAISNANKSRQAAQKSFRDKLNDIKKWHRDQLLAQKEAQLKEKMSELKHLNEMGELTASHLSELRRLHNEYNSSRSSGGDLDFNPTTSGGTGTTTGTPWDQTGNPGGTTRVVTAGAIPNTLTGSQFGGQQQVNINVTNDETLKEILKGISYEAIVEVIE